MAEKRTYEVPQELIPARLNEIISKHLRDHKSRSQAEAAERTIKLYADLQAQHGAKEATNELVRIITADGEMDEDAARRFVNAVKLTHKVMYGELPSPQDNQ